MNKYCDNVNCTYRLCKHHVANKNESLPYEIAELIYSSACRLRDTPRPNKRRRDKEIRRRR